MKDAQTVEKQKIILNAAWQAFATYGFRKTSMDDIARGAGMSRPALYLHFRNKDDICRSLVQNYYESAAEAVAAVLARDGPVADVLSQAFQAQLGDTMEVMLTSPHGMEMLETGLTIAADIKAEGEARLTGLYADWLKRIAINGHAHLDQSPEVTAGTITTALKGIKTNGPDFATAKARVSVLAQLLGRGLAAPD